MAEKKKFIDVSIPSLNSQIQVLGTRSNLQGRTIKLDLSRKLKGKGAVATFQIFNVNDESLVALPKRIELINSYLQRVIRKRTDNVEDSFIVNCQDVRATLKPFLITRKRVSRAVRKNLRNNAKEFLVSYAKERSYNELANEILSGTLQKNMLPKLKKIYPLSFCEVRVFESKELDKLDAEKIMMNDALLEKEDSEEKEEAAEKEVEEGAVSKELEKAEEGVNEEGEESTEDSTDTEEKKEESLDFEEEGDTQEGEDADKE